MIKGVSKRVVVVKSPDRRLFEEAIFVVDEREEGCISSPEELLAEARRIAAVSTGSRWKRRLLTLPPPLYALMGAAATAAVWAATAL